MKPENPAGGNGVTSKALTFALEACGWTDEFRLLHDIWLRLLQEEEVRDDVEMPRCEPTALPCCADHDACGGCFGRIGHG